MRNVKATGIGATISYNTKVRYSGSFLETKQLVSTYEQKQVSPIRIPNLKTGLFQLDSLEAGKLQPSVSAILIGAERFSVTSLRKCSIGFYFAKFLSSLS